MKSLLYITVLIGFFMGCSLFSPVLEKQAQDMKIAISYNGWLHYDSPGWVMVPGTSLSIASDRLTMSGVTFFPSGKYGEEQLGFKDGQIWISAKYNNEIQTVYLLDYFLEENARDGVSILWVRADSTDKATLTTAPSDPISALSSQTICYVNNNSMTNILLGPTQVDQGLIGVYYAWKYSSDSGWAKMNEDRFEFMKDGTLSVWRNDSLGIGTPLFRNDIFSTHSMFCSKDGTIDRVSLDAKSDKVDRAILRRPLLYYKHEDSTRFGTRIVWCAATQTMLADASIDPQKINASLYPLPNDYEKLVCLVPKGQTPKNP